MNSCVLKSIASFFFLDLAILLINQLKLAKLEVVHCYLLQENERDIRSISTVRVLKLQTDRRVQLHSHGSNFAELMTVYSFVLLFLEAVPASTT